MALVACIVLFVGIAIGGNFVCAQIPSESRAKHAVENIGMRDVRVTGRAPAFEQLGGCHTDDVTKFTVEGTDANGQRRTLEVCAPIIGGYTIRN